MNNREIVKASLTKEQIEKFKEIQRRRNLYVKYSDKELQDFYKIDLYEALDLDFYWGKEIPPKLLSRRVTEKKREYYPKFWDNRYEAFYCISAANKVLSDTLIKKVYESNFLDETIPEDRKYGEREFFEIFSPVFWRNGIFSEIQPTPELHSTNVKHFYNFWSKFKTVRVYDELKDVIDCSRSSIKYMRQEKKEIFEKKKEADLLRIKQLVAIAYKRDPRLVNKIDQGQEWSKDEEMTLKRLLKVFCKSKNIYQDVANGLNRKYKTNRNSEQVKAKMNK